MDLNEKLRTIKPNAICNAKNVFNRLKQFPLTLFYLNVLIILSTLHIPASLDLTALFYVTDISHKMP